MSLLERFIVKQPPVVREGLFTIVRCRGNKTKSIITIINEKGEAEDIKLGKEYTATNGIKLVGRKMHLIQYEGCYPVYDIQIR